MSPGKESPAGWRTSRYSLALWHLLLLLGLWSLLRLVLYVSVRPGVSVSELLLCYRAGILRDLLAGLVLTVPVLIWMWLLPNRWSLRRPFRLFFWCCYFVFMFLQLFLLVVEFFFFDEFKSRFNTVAVDYLWYPHEVFVNIWDSYHAGIVIAVCVLVSLIGTVILSRIFARMWERPFSPVARFGWVAAALGAVVLLGFGLNLKGARVSTDRTLNELSNNGAIAFAMAAWTRHLDFAAFYPTLERSEAYARARRLLQEPKTQFVEDGTSIRRRVSGDSNKPRLNVVLFLEESLGSEFWGCLGRPVTLTPEMDKLANEEGMLFTNIYASGNRTVRGFEGVLSSFPPLPGDSIVKRDLSDNVETIARVLKRDGYNTVFLYGGRGLFDGMRSYATRNGYDRFIEQKHFAKPTFSTIWGVCDEDVFKRGLEEMRALAGQGKPFLATILSVSNHKPFTYPKGRIAEDPERRKREHAVKYSDYALGEFFRGAKREPFWTNTIFVVVADHGARVYGSQSIPIHSYEIPWVILGPAVVKQPQRLSQLGCSLDVAPTVLGLLGRPYETMFFGRDLLSSPADPGRVTLNHNRDVGLLMRDQMVVLGLMQTVEFYHGNPKEMEMVPLARPGLDQEELKKDAIALYQVADELYTQRRYRIDGEPAKSSSNGARISSTISGVGGLTQ